MWNFSVSKSLGILLQTWPYLLLRAVVFGAFAVIFVILIGSGGLLGHELVPMFSNQSSLQGSVYGAGAGALLGGAVVRILREYTLYLVKAGHVAVMDQLLRKGMVPEGGQLSFGQRAVRETFVEASVLFAIDQVVKGALGAVTKRLQQFGAFIPGLAFLFGLAAAIIRVAVEFVDEIVLAQIMRHRPANAWRAGADYVVLYAQNAKLMLKNAAWLTLFIALGGVGAFAAAVGPALIYFGVYEGPYGIYALSSSAAFAFFIIHVVLEPFAVICMLQAYDSVTAGQFPDNSVEDQLARHSEKFRELRDHVDDWRPHNGVPAE